MRKTLFFVLVSVIFLPLIIFAEEPQVYTDSDLQPYKYKGDDSTYRYNQKILRDNAKQEEYQQTQREFQDESRANQQAEQEEKKQKARERINEIEKKKAQSKIDDTNELHFGGFIGQARARDKKERNIKTENELDEAYRDAGISQEREIQKRAIAADKRASDAEKRARAAEASEGNAQNQLNIEQNTPKTYWDSGSRRQIFCGGGVCN